MVKCPFCKTVHVDNTIFCSECGNYLLEDASRKTDPLDIDETGWAGDVTDAAKTAPPFDPGTRPLAIRLKIGPNHREVEMPLDKVIHIGRVDPASNVFPEVDVTNDGAQASSVSRRHVKISRQAGMVVVEDMGSVNGTYINGKRLDPYLPEALNDGDTLQLGRFMIEVEIRKR